MRPAARLRPRRRGRRRVRLPRRRRAARAGPPGRALDHLPDDARVLARAPARAGGRRGAGRPRRRGAPGSAARRRARRLVGAGRRRRAGRHREDRLRARVRGARGEQCRRGRPAGSGRAAGRGARHPAPPLLGRRRPAWSWRSGTATGPRSTTTAASTPTCTRSRRCCPRPTSSGATTCARRRCASSPASSTTWPRRTTGGCPSTSPPTGRRCSTTTRTGPPTRSAPPAPRSGTGWSGRGSRCTCAPGSATPLPAGSWRTRSGWSTPPSARAGPSTAPTASSTPSASTAPRWCGSACTGCSPRRVAVAAALHAATGDQRWADLHEQWWAYAERYLIDRERGSWHHELAPDNTPDGQTWPGKPDLYHAVGATLVPRLPLTPTASVALRDGQRSES